MSVNPDLAAHEESNRVIGCDIKRIPNTGELRFKEVEWEGGEKRRILQQYQWSTEDGKHDFYDVPMVTE